MRILLATAVCALGACGGRSISPPPVQSHVELADLAALESQIAKHGGRPLIVNFWATWCEPCVEELPDLVAVAREAKDVDVLLVSYDLRIPGVDKSKVCERVEKFIHDRQWNLPALVLDISSTDAINARFDLPGPIPVTLAFDKFGHIADRENGPCDKARFEQLFAKAR